MKKMMFIMAILGWIFPKTIGYAHDELKIVTSFYPMYAITSEIVGDHHDVLMINSGNGIHGFEPSASDVAAIYDADIFIYHSTILESWTKNLEANIGNYKVKMIQASKDMEFLKVPGLEGVEPIEGKDHSNLYDPHSWLDPVEVAREATLIAEALSEINPENADDYRMNAKKFTEKAMDLLKQYEPIFQATKNKTFVTQHTAFYYLAERFGLKQLGVTGISSENEPSARQLNEVIEFVKKYDVKTIFVEPNVSDRIAKVIADSTGVEIVSLSPLESDPKNELSFLENLEKQLAVLSKHLDK